MDVAVGGYSSVLICSYMWMFESLCPPNGYKEDIFCDTIAFLCIVIAPHTFLFSNMTKAIGWDSLEDRALVTQS